MLVSLLTPLMIATAPATLTVDADAQYNHETQTRHTVEMTEPTNGYTQRTWNGTQTFDFNGNPRDSDND